MYTLHIIFKKLHVLSNMVIGHRTCSWRLSGSWELSASEALLCRVVVQRYCRTSSLFCSESDQWRSDGYLRPLTERFQGSLPFSDFFLLWNRLLPASCFVHVSIYLCVCMKQLGSHWTGVCEVSCCGFLLKSVKKIYVWLNFNKNYTALPFVTVSVTDGTVVAVDSNQ